MKTSTDPRHQHRIKVVQHLFSSSFHKTDDPLTTPVWSNLPKIDKIITEIAPEWPIDKLNAIDLAILREAVYELIIDKSQPLKVIIDEAVEIAKTYGGSGSPAFINGALGNLASKYELQS
jgi:transcription antitermination protein NusB